jgi:hypothetical protein
MIGEITLFDTLVRNGSDKKRFTTEGREKVCRSLLEWMMCCDSNFLEYCNVPQLNYLNRVLPVPLNIDRVRNMSVSVIPEIDDSFVSHMNSLDLDLAGFQKFVIKKSQYRFLMDLPFKRIQDQKIMLRQKSRLSIRDALFLKVIGVDVFSSKYDFDLFDILMQIQVLTISEIFDLLVVMHPGDFLDLAVIYQCVPKNFGFIGNEAYTPEDLIEKWISCFGSFDYDLSGNVLTNLYIRARFFSEHEPFFPSARDDFSGNVLVNPPYPVSVSLKTLFDRITEKLDRIDNMLLILPMDMGLDLQAVVFEFQDRFPDNIHTLMVKDTFYKYSAVPRKASHTKFVLHYIGKNKAKFRSEFVKFMNGE